MRIIKTWCESTKEGIDYLEFNKYNPICRLSDRLWLVRTIGNKLDDVKVVL